MPLSAAEEPEKSAAKGSSEVPAFVHTGGTSSSRDNVETVDSAYRPEEEDAAVKPKRAPNAPTRQEVLDHEISHEPYRDWCPACVAGRGRVEYHYRQDHGEDALARIGVDYGFFSGKDGQDTDEEEGTPIICGKDSKHRWFIAHVVPCKGCVHPWPAKVLGRELQLAGHRRYVFASDGEPAIVELKRQAALIALTRAGMECVPEVSSKGDSAGNGLAEGAVKEIKAKVRTLVHALQQLHSLKVEPNSQCLPWLVAFAAALMNRSRRGPDGRTAWELRKGRACRRQLCAFGEKFLYLPAGKRVSQLDTGYKEAFFFGVLDGSDEVWAGTPEGVVKARSFKRLPEDARADAEGFMRVIGTPWEPTPGDIAAPMIGDPISIEVRPVVPASELPKEPSTRASSRHHVHIRREVELKKFGMTDGCPGCLAAQLGVTAARHSDACRARIEEAMRTGGFEEVENC